MSKTRNLLKTGVAALTVIAVGGLTVGTADADPTPADTLRTYTAVGSDTTQDVWNGLTNDGSTNGGPVSQIGSYDAFGSATIKPKAAGSTFNRPAGSGAGVRALSAVWDPSYTSHDYQGASMTHREVDFARSSSGPTAGTGLTYLPFARDAVSVAIRPSADGSGPSAFTTARLAAIYGGPDDNTPGTGVTYAAGSGLPVLSGKTLRPLLPQSSSGTRTFFLSAIGVAGSLASYVEPPASTLAENDGRVLTDPGMLIPFSVAQWIAQRNGQVGVLDTTGGLKIAGINGLAPVTSAAPNLAPGALYGAKNPQGNYSTAPVAGVGTFNRDTYNVIPTAFLSASATSGQKNLVKKLTGVNGGQLGSNPAKVVIKKYGFGTLAYLGNADFYRSGIWLH